MTPESNLRGHLLRGSGSYGSLLWCNKVMSRNKSLLAQVVRRDEGLESISPFRTPVSNDRGFSIVDPNRLTRYNWFRL